MTAVPPGARCGLDTVEIERVERLLKTSEDLTKFFSKTELEESGNGAGRAASLAARFAAKEACCKMFPRETALQLISPPDFWVQRDNYGAPTVQVSDAGRRVLDRYRVGAIRLSLTHTSTSASAIAWAEPRQLEAPWFGKLFYHAFPFRRSLVVSNMRLVFGDALNAEQIRGLAQAYYAHFIRFLVEFVRLPFMSREKRKKWIRVENIESPLKAHDNHRGLLILTGHFGNWEAATVAGIGQYPQFNNRFHFVRRPLKPAIFNEFITRRFQRAGFGSIAKRGSLDTILDLLSKGNGIVFVFDQHASGRDGVVVDFCGHPASTFKSLAILALSTGVDVIPASSWREPDGTHVLRFEDPLPLIQHEDTNEAIRLNTRAYNAALERLLLRHPEQWIWMHRRWKAAKLKS
jgi:phosphopantetheine--protein transferase-like protein